MSCSASDVLRGVLNMDEGADATLMRTANASRLSSTTAISGFTDSSAAASMHARMVTLQNTAICGEEYRNSPLVLGALDHRPLATSAWNATPSIRSSRATPPTVDKLRWWAQQISALVHRLGCNTSVSAA